MELVCRRDEGHAICTCCELGGFISRSLDSSFAISEKGLISSYHRTCRVILNIAYVKYCFSWCFKSHGDLEVTSFCYVALYSFMPGYCNCNIIVDAIKKSAENFS